MCDASDYAPNTFARDVVAEVGNLPEGTRYRDPDGNTWMVTSERGVNDVTVVNIDSGKLLAVHIKTRLGHDRRGRLYAGRFLNSAKCDDALLLAKLGGIFAGNQQGN